MGRVVAQGTPLLIAPMDQVGIHRIGIAMLMRRGARKGAPTG